MTKEVPWKRGFVFKYALTDVIQWWCVVDLFIPHGSVPLVYRYVQNISSLLKALISLFKTMISKNCGPVFRFRRRVRI